MGKIFIFYTVTNMVFLENRHLNKELEFLTIIISHLLQLSILSKCFDFILKNLFLTNEHILYDIRNIIPCTKWKSIDFPLRGRNSILMSISNRYYSDYKIMTKFVFHFSIFLKLNNSLEYFLKCSISTCFICYPFSITYLLTMLFILQLKNPVSKIANGIWWIITFYTYDSSEIILLPLLSYLGSWILILEG